MLTPSSGYRPTRILPFKPFCACPRRTVRRPWGRRNDQATVTTVAHRFSDRTSRLPWRTVLPPMADDPGRVCGDRLHRLDGRQRDHPAAPSLTACHHAGNHWADDASERSVIDPAPSSKQSCGSSLTSPRSVTVTVSETVPVNRLQTVRPPEKPSAPSPQPRMRDHEHPKDGEHHRRASGDQPLPTRWLIGLLAVRTPTSRQSGRPPIGKNVRGARKGRWRRACGDRSVGS
jgi:hypothetical protein